MRDDCPKWGLRGGAWITHVCGLTDTHHWLYKAGYEQGWQDALKTRDLSPMGGGPNG